MRNGRAPILLASGKQAAPRRCGSPTSTPDEVVPVILDQQAKLLSHSGRLAVRSQLSVKKGLSNRFFLFSFPSQELFSPLIHSFRCFTLFVLGEQRVQTLLQS